MTDPNDNESSVVQVMDWRRMGEKQLCEIMMTCFCWRIYASLRLNVLKRTCWWQCSAAFTIYPYFHSYKVRIFESMHIQYHWLAAVKNGIFFFHTQPIYCLHFSFGNETSLTLVMNNPLVRHGAYFLYLDCWHKMEMIVLHLNKSDFCYFSYTAGI